MEAIYSVSHWIRSEYELQSGYSQSEESVPRAAPHFIKTLYTIDISVIVLMPTPVGHYTPLTGNPKQSHFTLSASRTHLR